MKNHAIQVKGLQKSYKDLHVLKGVNFEVAKGSIFALLGPSNSPLIFLDEPTTGLDPEARIEVWKLVKELASNGKTVFLTTQYLDEAEQLADRIAILHQGEIIVSGTLAELKKQFPPAKVEYIEKQPTLEEIFLAIISKKTI